MERRLGDLSELTTSIVSMNLNGRFKPDESTPLGKAVIQSLLGGTCVQLLFGQQASFSPSSQLPPGFRLIGGDASFIAYDSRLLSPCEPGWQYRRRVRDLTSNTSKWNDDQDVPRLRGLSTLNYVACRLMSKELGIRFVALSWFTDEAVKGKRQRQLVLHKVLSFARGLAEIEQLPLILAGSFHLSEADAFPVLENSNFRGIHCSGYLANSMRREIRASNLFFCTSPPVELSSVRPRLLRGLVKVRSGSRETFRNPEDAFYHDSVFASMKLLVSIVDVPVESKTLNLNERFNLILNCRKGLDSTIRGTRYSRENRQVAVKKVETATENIAKSAITLHTPNDPVNIIPDQKTLDLNETLNDPNENVLIEQERPTLTTERVQTLTSEQVDSEHISSTSSFLHNDTIQMPMFESSVTPTCSESRATVAGYCLKRSQREPKQVVDLRDCLNRCDIIRGRFLNCERDLTMCSRTATDYLAAKEDDDDATTERLVSTARRLSTISERGESSCSDISTGSEAESLKVLSDDDNDTYSEIESIGNAQPERRNTNDRIESRHDFIDFSIVCKNNDMVDLASDLTGKETCEYTDTYKQSTNIKSVMPAICGDTETTNFESRCQHLALQRSISLDNESDHSYVEHCQACVNDWRSTFAPVMLDHQLTSEDERFVEGATDSDDSDTYLLAEENELDSECEENKTVFAPNLSESMQGLLDSVPDAKLKKVRLDKNAACVLQ